MIDVVQHALKVSAKLALYLSLCADQRDKQFYYLISFHGQRLRRPPNSVPTRRGDCNDHTLSNLSTRLRHIFKVTDNFKTVIRDARWAQCILQAQR